MGTVSFIFLLIYYLDPSVLSGVSCFVMCLCLADYLVPTLAPRIFGSNTWTTEQQQRLHEICSNLVKTRRRIIGWWSRLFVLKEEKPKMLCTFATWSEQTWSYYKVCRNGKAGNKQTSETEREKNGIRSSQLSH
ncbi:hypothetical protein AB205_0122940, partial [Aquarana catesbeiana]